MRNAQYILASVYTYRVEDMVAANLKTDVLRCFCVHRKSYIVYRIYHEYQKYGFRMVEVVVPRVWMMRDYWLMAMIHRLFICHNL